MKKLKTSFILLFFGLLLLPVLFFNKDENAISKIDNRMLAPNPLKERDEEVKFTDQLEEYVSDRIGFRDQFIKSYMIANDALFGEMVHPSYMYGKDGYIFTRPDPVKEYGEYEDAFVDLLVEMQSNLEKQDITFLFLFDPSKQSILRDKLPERYVYDNSWLDEFFKKLDENGIHYVDNTKTLLECRKKGIECFNVKYNAGHWNDRGAFYGVNAALKNLSKRGEKVHVNKEDEYEVSQKLNTSLPVSEFPIHEYEPIYHLKDSDSVSNLTDDYIKDIKLNKEYPDFGYYVNKKRMTEGAERALIFQGSYINSMGYKFFQNAFSEYIAVHAYQNVLNYEYYINIFHPDVVIFETAEYTFKPHFYDLSSRIK